MTTSPPLLECRGLSLRRGGRLVVKGAALSLRQGEIVGLMGPNGTGKSTLLDGLSGILPLAEGEVLLNGRSLAKLSIAERAKAMAFVPQKERPLFSYSVRELCEMSRLAWGQGWAPSAQDREAVERAIQEAGIGHLAEKSILELSGGELQMALIARALAQDAPVLLLDEPTASLDLARHGAAARLLRAHEGAILVATHDINWALTLCTRLICLSEGRIIWSGEPKEAHEPLEECFGVPLRWLETEEGPQALPRRGP